MSRHHPTRIVLSTFMVLSMCCWLGCPDDPPAEACTYAGDGVCDEPANCAYGSDSSDCDQACSAATIPAHLGGACAHRRGDQVPAVATADIAYGSHDLIIPVPSGCDERRDMPRQVRLYVPTSYDPARRPPLVLNLPGHRVSHIELAGYTNLDAFAERHGTPVAYLEQEWRGPGGVCRGGEQKWAWWTDWRWGEMPITNPDLIFVERLLDQLRSMVPHATDRVIATGHSRGAAMSLILALEMPDRIAAAVSQSGFTEFGFDARIAAFTGPPMPIILIHGVADTDVPVGRSDSIARLLGVQGWSHRDLLYLRLDNVAHRWQPQLNDRWYSELLDMWQER